MDWLTTSVRAYLLVGVAQRRPPLITCPQDSWDCGLDVPRTCGTGWWLGRLAIQVDSSGGRANNTIDIEIDTQKGDHVVGLICIIHSGPEAAERTLCIVKTPQTGPHNSPTPQQLLSPSFSDGPAWGDHSSIWGLGEMARRSEPREKAQRQNGSRQRESRNHIRKIRPALVVEEIAKTAEDTLGSRASEAKR